MRVQVAGDLWYVVRGHYLRTVYFALLVDHDRASWTNQQFRASSWRAKTDADQMLVELRRRAKRKRQDL